MYTVDNALTTLYFIPLDFVTVNEKKQSPISKDKILCFIHSCRHRNTVYSFFYIRFGWDRVKLH